MNIEITEKLFGNIQEETHTIRELAVKGKFAGPESAQLYLDDIIQHTTLLLRLQNEAIIKPDPELAGDKAIPTICRRQVKSGTVRGD